MKVVGENVKFIIIKTGLRAQVVARKAPLDESAQQFQPPKDIELSVIIFLGPWKANDMSFFAKKNNVLLASMMCP